MVQMTTTRAETQRVNHRIIAAAVGSGEKLATGEHRDPNVGLHRVGWHPVEIYVHFRALAVITGCEDELPQARAALRGPSCADAAPAKGANNREPIRAEGSTRKASVGHSVVR